MQEMERDENAPNFSSTYSGYSGEQIYHDEETPIRRQKIDADSETFQDALVRRIKKELQADAKNTNEHLIGPRLMLALASIGALMVMFGIIVFAVAFGHLSSDALGLIGASMFFLLGAIVIINGTFNAIVAPQKAQKEKDKVEK